MQVEYEKIDIKDASFPIKTYIKDTNEDRLHSEPHIHDEIEFIYMMDGEMEFIIEDESTIVNEGDIIIIKGFTAHWSKKLNNDYAKLCLLQFNINLLYSNSIRTDRYFANFINKSDFKYKVIGADEDPDYCKIAEILIDIANEYKEKAVAFDMAIMSGIYKLFSIMYRRNFFTRPDESLNIGFNYNIERIQEVLQYISNHYGDILKVEDVSSMLNINYSYFCRIFKKATGMTFVEYLNYYRVGVAKKKLLQESSTVTEIMLDTGFSSHSYFNRVFKKQTGYSPTDYRGRFGKKDTANYDDGNVVKQIVHF